MVGEAQAADSRWLLNPARLGQHSGRGQPSGPQGAQSPGGRCPQATTQVTFPKEGCTTPMTCRGPCHGPSPEHGPTTAHIRNPSPPQCPCLLRPAPCYSTSYSLEPPPSSPVETLKPCSRVFTCLQGWGGQEWGAQYWEARGVAQLRGEAGLWGGSLHAPGSPLQHHQTDWDSPTAPYLSLCLENPPSSFPHSELLSIPQRPSSLKTFLAPKATFSLGSQSLCALL